MEKETIELVKKMIEDGNLSQEIAEKYCPELKGSEDERIFEEIYKDLHTYYMIQRDKFVLTDIKEIWDDKWSKAKAWLEKREDTYDYKRVDLGRFDERIREFSDMLEDKPKPYWDGWYEAMDWIRVNGTPFEDEKQGEHKPTNMDLDTLVIKLEETIGTSPHSRETIKEFFQEAIQKYLNALQEANKKIGELVDENYYLKEQMSTVKVEPKFKVGDRIRHRSQNITATIVDIKKGEYILSDSCGSHMPIEWQYNYELIVRPKFHKGDWVVTDKSNVVQIKAIEDNKYVLENTMRFSVEYVDKCWRKWTIQDAKDGNVLAAHECLVIFKEIDGLNIKCYCTYHYMNIEKFYIDTLQNKTAFTPATKEQRDLLFSKMKEAGYVWNAEKKELNKIEQIQNPAWSEEDEVNINYLIDYCNSQENGKHPILTTLVARKLSNWLYRLKSGELHIKTAPNLEWTDSDENGFESVCNVLRLKLDESNSKPLIDMLLRMKASYCYRKDNSVGLTEDDEKTIHLACEFIRHRAESNGSIGGVDYSELIKRLESLRPQNTWKPSDEQIKTLEKWLEDTRYKGDCRYVWPIFESLYNNLKKLK